MKKGEWVHIFLLNHTHTHTEYLWEDVEGIIEYWFPLNIEFGRDSRETLFTVYAFIYFKFCACTLFYWF